MLRFRQPALLVEDDVVISFDFISIWGRQGKRECFVYAKKSGKYPESFFTTCDMCVVLFRVNPLGKI